MIDEPVKQPRVTVKADEMNASEVLKLTVEVWKKTVDVQEHFNDIALRLRSIAITVLVGAVGAAFYVARDAGYWASLGIVVMAACGWAAFFLMDRYWYHLFLRAAGIHAGNIENQNRDVLPALYLSNTISAESGAVQIPRWPSKYVQIFKGGTYSSTQRLVLFYQAGFLILAIAALMLLVLGIVGLFVGERRADATGTNPAGISGDIHINSPQPQPTPVLDQSTAPDDEPTQNASKSPPGAKDPFLKEPDDPKSGK